ncbi:hypothetical protein HZH68_016841 [Vespula germanica]|uniref:Uncharacterized protein n=1 Tax=Vespula germanica TaxID=30212 RepID=A0A834MR52_VESGE|nr:hypothetical protein HZH68_016841 [Vespula germanica]
MPVPADTCSRIKKDKRRREEKNTKKKKKKRRKEKKRKRRKKATTASVKIMKFKTRDGQLEDRSTRAKLEYQSRV